MEKGEGAKRAMGWKGEIKCGGVMIRERERERERERKRCYRRINIRTHYAIVFFPPA